MNNITSLDPLCFPFIVCFNFTGAVPKKILEIMKVPGLTRENVASHLQVVILWFL